MEKMKMQSENLVDENVEFIGKKFPNCIVEGKNDNGEVVKMVDFDLLKQELSKVLVEGNQERYVMNWPDKRQAILTANAPISKTLRPVVADEVKPTGCDSNGQAYLSSGSVGKDGTLSKFDSENLYIEGDNLDVLKLLRETYLNKIKMIYIDPPYNTGNDFVYEDDFAIDTEEYLQRSNQVDEQGNRLAVNNESNGRFHTDWLNMIYPRLKIARDLLTDDGVIFISIDDNEQANLKKICDEIFGPCNFVGIAPRKTRGSATTQGDNELQKLNDYLLIYFKNKSISKFNLKIVGEKQYPYSDERGEYYIVPMQDNGPNGTREARPNLWYPIYKTNEGKLTYNKPDYECETFLPLPHQNKDGCWMWSKSKFDKDNADLIIHNNKVYIKHYYSELEDQNKYQRERMWLEDFQNAKGTLVVNDLFKEKGLFSNPKPLELLKWCLKNATNKSDIILDFFSGSATTAHAVMQLNAEDGGNRKFIMVQLPEITDEKSEAYKAGYRNICEIGKERIRRAGKKIKEENQMTALNLDIGFRVLKLDSSNMKDVYYSPSETKQSNLLDLVTNIKEDRSAEDLLFQVMLDMGVELSKEIEKKTINDKTVYIVGEYDEESAPNLVCCFDENISEEVVTEIAKLKPLYAVFRDSSFASDSISVNFDQIFETYSPTTTRKVL